MANETTPITTKDTEKAKGGNHIPYMLFKWLVVRPLLYLFYQERIYGAENVPLTGNLIVVSNHASDFDPLIVGSCMGRPVAFMAKEELFEIPVLKQAITAFGAYPVKRGAGDRAAIRSAIESINKGWATGIFCKVHAPLMAKLQNQSWELP